MLQVIRLENFPILNQLQLEEALLRNTSDNWCLINHGSSHAIVMGISQKTEEVIDLEAHSTFPIPIIRRYSGGGTVVIEPSTVFVTLILNHNVLDVPPFPKDVIKWTERLYKPVFQDLPFIIQENDYAIGNRKCGGNAQYFSKGRLVHHTSFLWDYTDTHMQLLKLPPKMPSYRNGRSHCEFLCKLKPHFTSKTIFLSTILKKFSAQFLLNNTKLDSAMDFLSLSHRKSTTLINL